MLQFNINVPSSVYAKYYFDLRLLAEANELTFPSEPLSKERALKLEAMAQNYEDKMAQEIVQNGMKRWSSLDKLHVNRRSVAILSWVRQLRQEQKLDSQPTTSSFYVSV